MLRSILLTSVAASLITAAGHSHESRGAAARGSAATPAPQRLRRVRGRVGRKVGPEAGDHSGERCAFKRELRGAEKGEHRWRSSEVHV